MCFLGAFAIYACGSQEAGVEKTAPAEPPDEPPSEPTRPAKSATPAESKRPEEPAIAGVYGSEHCLGHDGRRRCYQLLVPESASASAPLVIDMHGFGSNANQQRAISGFSHLARTEGFIVAWPQGVEASFNAGLGCCGSAVKERVDDVGFVRALVADVATLEQLDLDRVYVTGLSNGCAMAQRVAAQASDLVAAAACMAMYLIARPAPDYTPVPLMEIHGTADSVVPYQGDRNGAAALFPTAIGNVETWAKLNGCAGDPVKTDGPSARATFTRFGECKDSADVVLLTLDGVGHVPYLGIQGDVDTARVAWAFMREFSRR